MNTAQQTIAELKLKVPLDRQYEHDFLMECFKVWSPYQDSKQYSYPYHQLRALEKKYGTSLAVIKEKYGSKEK